MSNMFLVAGSRLRGQNEKAPGHGGALKKALNRKPLIGRHKRRSREPLRGHWLSAADGSTTDNTCLASAPSNTCFATILQTEQAPSGMNDLPNHQQASGLGTWDLVAIGAYFVIVFGVAMTATLKKSRNTVSGFFLAGRHMTWLPVGASLFASNIGSEHFIGLSGTGAASGISVGAFEFNALFLLPLLGFVFLPVYISSKVCTLPEYMSKRFGGQRIRMYLACLSLMLYIFTKISVNLYSGALFIQQALNWNMYVSILALLILAAICTICGGLAAVIYVDIIQVAIMIVGSFFLLVMGLKEVGGWSQLQEKYIQAIPAQIFDNPNQINGTCGVPGEDSWVLLRHPVGSDMPWPGFLLGQTPASVWYWCADQIMVQKVLSARSLSHAQGGTIFTGWLKVLPLFLIVIPGMISRVLYTEEVGCIDPDVCQRVCQNRVSCSNIAFPRLVLGIMPEGMKGLMISVMIAALMSDLTSIFNSASTLFTMDVYRRLRPGAGSSELLLVGRMCVGVLMGFSIAWIPIVQQMQGGQLYIYIQSIAAYLSPPIAAVFCLAILWPRMNEQGAFWSLMFGLVVGTMRMALEFYYSQPLCMELDTRPAFIKNIHYMYFAAFLFWMTVLCIVVVSLATPADDSFKVVRTTFFTRLSKEVRPDEKDLAECDRAQVDGKESVELLEPPIRNANPDGDVTFASEVDQTVFRRIASRLGMTSLLSRQYAHDDQEMKDQANLNRIATLTQSRKQKLVLQANLILILILGVFVNVFFSVNPLSSEQIDQLRRAVNSSTVSRPSSSP